MNEKTKSSLRMGLSETLTTGSGMKGGAGGVICSRYLDWEKI
jgi:hypothetical protein